MSLLPCAHCGGVAELSGYKRNQFGGYFVECRNCPANVGKNFCGDGEAGGTVEDHSFDTESEAIAAWNRRTNSTEFEQIKAEFTNLGKLISSGYFPPRHEEELRDSYYKILNKLNKNEGASNE